MASLAVKGAVDSSFTLQIREQPAPARVYLIRASPLLLLRLLRMPLRPPLLCLRHLELLPPLRPHLLCLRRLELLPPLQPPLLYLRHLALLLPLRPPLMYLRHLALLRIVRGSSGLQLL
jgi:hypothetical protein